MQAPSKTFLFHSVGYLLNRGLPFLAAFASARVLGPSEFGIFIGATSLFATLLLAVDLGLSLTVTSRVAARSQEGVDVAAQTLSSALIATASMGVVIAVAIATAASLLSELVFSNAAHGAVILAGALYVPSAAVGSVSLAGLQGFQRYRSIAAIGAIFGIAHIAVVLAMSILFGALGAAWGAAATMAVRACLAIFAARADFAFPSFPSLRLELRNLVANAAPACLAALATAPAATFVVSAIFRHPNGAHEAGGYGVALQGFTLAMVVPSIVTQYALPQLARLPQASRRDHRRVKAVAIKYAGVAATSCALIALPVAIWAREILTLLGHQYASYDAALRIMMIAAVVAAPQGVFSNYLLARGQHWVRAGTAWSWPAVVVCALWANAPDAADAAWANLTAWFALTSLRAGMFAANRKPSLSQSPLS